jgi:AcrR family transcriptional regulator
MQEAKLRNASRKQALRKRKASRSSRSKSTQSDSSTSPGTREKLLDAGELLFSVRGYNCVSTREIAAAANANLGSIPYYFGSKENLLKEVIRRRALPELEDRAVGVSRVLEAAGDGLPDVVAILKAYLDPVVLSRARPWWPRSTTRVCARAAWRAPDCGTQSIARRESRGG